MAIPDYQSIMLPFLELLSDGYTHRTRDIIEKLGEVFQLTEDEKQELLSGGQPIFNNRVGWARTYLKKALAIESPSRGVLTITERGRSILEVRPSKVDNTLLSKFPEFLDFVHKKGIDDGNTSAYEVTAELKTPDEVIENSYKEIRQALIRDILERIKSMSPIFFEKLVVNLLVKMGYGGSIKDAGRATKLTNDEGIDGIIKEDKLGLDIIYIQAKRWDANSVGRPDIQSFVGALDGQRANKGIFITTSGFAKSAIEYVKTISKKVILIDGQQLAEYMIDYDLGVSTIQTYELKRIDSDYFEE